MYLGHMHHGCGCCSCFCRRCDYCSCQNAPYYPPSQVEWPPYYYQMVQQAQEEAAKQPKADIMLADLTPQVLMHNTKDSKTNELPSLGT